MDDVYLSVTIDTECDKGPAWRCQAPLAFEGVLRGLPQVLEPLFRWTRSKATYLVSPEVLRDARCADLLRGLRRSADFGTHLHAEFADGSDVVPAVTSAFQRDFSQEREGAMLQTLTDLYRNCFDAAPTAFRAGRFGIGEATVSLLEGLGYRVESSVTPHMRWDSAGAKGLSFEGAPTQPYHPDPHAPGRVGTSRLWEIPVTIRPRMEHVLGPIAARVARVVEPRWLRPTHASGEALITLAKDEIRAARSAAPGRPVFLTCMFHNVEITPGTSPYARSEAEAARIAKNLAGLLTFARDSGIKVVGLSDAPDILEREAA